MPDVYFIGELESAMTTDFTQLSVSYAFISGSPAWYLKSGNSHGETHTSVSSLQDWAVLNFPLDVHYDASSTEGWPFLVCEVSMTFLYHT